MSQSVKHPALDLVQVLVSGHEFKSCVGLHLKKSKSISKIYSSFTVKLCKGNLTFFALFIHSLIHLVVQQTCIDS